MKKYKSSLNQADQEEIERYIQGDMEESEVSDFEKRLSGNEELRNEVTLYRNLIAYIEFKSFISSKEKPARKLVAFPFFKVAVAAVTILGLSLVFWIFRDQFYTDDQTLYTSYFYPDPGLPVAMSSSDAYSFDEGMVSYKEEKYADAMVSWKELLEVNGKTDTLLYYLAMAELNLNQEESAQLYLEQVAGMDDSEFQKKAIWYQSLIYLKYEDWEKAISALEKIKEKDPRAQELLEQLLTKE